MQHSKVKSNKFDLWLLVTTEWSFLGLWQKEKAARGDPRDWVLGVGLRTPHLKI
jgi:hypothetical protein